MIKSMLTTIDNKFDPFNDWDNWFAFDNEKSNLVHQYTGMSCCELVDRFDPSVSEMPDAYANDLNEWAIDRICKSFAPFGIFKKVQKDV